MIENRTVAVAQCDACGHVNYANDNDEFQAGYELTIVDYENAAVFQHQAYACRATHIGKAGKAVLDRFEANDKAALLEQPPLVPEGHDATPLPQPEKVDCA